MIFVAVCLEPCCYWSHCDFSEKDEKLVIEDADKHHKETGHYVSVDKKRGSGYDFENIITFERKE